MDYQNILSQYSRLTKAREAINQTLHSGQQEILNDPSRFKVLIAGRKWRKTSFVVSRLFDGALQNNLVYSYIAPFRKQAKDIAWGDHILRQLRVLEKSGIEYKLNESELSVTIAATGGKVNLFGVDNADALRGISNWGGIAADEYADWKQNIWPTIIRPNLATHKAWAIIAGTPKGFNHLWDAFNNTDYKSFHYSSHGNPELDRDELLAMEKEYKQMGELYYRQEILASFERPMGSVYEEWDVARQFIPVPYDVNLPVHITFDFGVNDPTAIIWIQPNGSEWRIIDYYEANNADISHFVSVIRSKPYKQAELYTGDPAGKARSITTNTSPIDEYAKHQIFIRSKDGVRIPDQVRAAHAVMPSLYVDNTLERFRDCLLNYRYPSSTEKRSQLDTSNEIPVHDEYSHAMRALEYYAVNIKDISPDKAGGIRTFKGGDQVTGYGKTAVRTFRRR